MDDDNRRRRWAEYVARTAAQAGGGAPDATMDVLADAYALTAVTLGIPKTKVKAQLAEAMRLWQRADGAAKARAELERAVLAPSTEAG